MNHAITLRNVLCGGLIYAALGAIQVASAYVTPSPPPGFSNTPDGWTYKGQWVDGSARSSADLTVGGRRIQIPVYMRVSASKAPQLAAQYIFRHPLITAVTVASILVPLGVQWANNNWTQTLPQDNLPVSTGFIFSSNHVAGRFSTWHDVCRAIMNVTPGGHRFDDGLTSNIANINPQTNSECWVYGIQNNLIVTRSVIRASCPLGWFITPAGCVQSAPLITRPLTEEEFVPLVSPQIQPQQVPNIIPSITPLPIEQPVINPAPRTVPVPYTPPVPRPLIVPLSDPVMIPNTEPQQWRQPLVQINPSPTAANPWRVSLNPKERITTSPHGITDPVSDLDPATPAQPSAESDFCIRNPEVLACARVPEFDIPEEELTTRTEIIDYQPEHFMSGGSCPRIVTASIGGQTITIWDTPQYCQFISSYFRPVLLAIAAFTSMMIVAGGFRSV